MKSLNDLPKAGRSDVLLFVAAVLLGLAATLVSFLAFGPARGSLSESAGLLVNVLHGFWVHEVAYPLHLAALGWAAFVFGKEGSS